MSEALGDNGMESQPFLLSNSTRVIVDGWLAGIQATREGVFDVFYVQFPDDTAVKVTPENADEFEADIRAHFGPHYPEIASTEAQG